MFLVQKLSAADCQKAESEIRALLKQLSDRPVMFSATVQADNVHHVGAYWDGHLVGLVMATYMEGWFGSRLYLDGVVVDAKHRRQGCLQAMMDFVEVLAVQLECSSIAFTSSRPGAKEVYVRLGFETPTTAFRKTIG